MRSLILTQANAVRSWWTQRQHERELEQRRAGANQFVTAPAAPGGDLMAQLKELGAMKQAGLLSDGEFASAKAKLLG